MSPHRLKARGGAGSKICLPPPSISPPLTCKILQERRALRKLLKPPHLTDHSLKPSLLPARRVPINTKEITRHKKVPAVARLATAPSQKHAPCHPFKKPFYVGHGVSTSSMPGRGNGSASAAFCGATRVKRNVNVNVGSKHTGKPDASQARLSRALACCTLRNKTGEKCLTSTRALECADHEKKTIPARQNCDSTSAFGACKGLILSNESHMQHSYNVELNEDDCNINLIEEAPVWSGQDLPSNLKLNYDRDQVYLKKDAPVWCEQDFPSILNANYDRDPVLPLSSFYKVGIGEHIDSHNLSTRRSGNRDGFDTCRLVSHSNANHQECDRSRDWCKMSGSPDVPDIVDCFSGGSTGCKNMLQTQASNQVYSDNDQKVDLSDNPRILGNDASEIFNDICTPHSIASSQEFYVADSSKNAHEKQKTSDEVIFDNPCKLRAHRYARLQECDDTQSTRIGLEKPRGSDLYEVILSSRNHGKGGTCDSIQNDDDDDACKSESQVNAIILQDSDHNRSRGNSSSKPRSHLIEQAALESPWCDVGACEFAIHESFADYQEVDEVNRIDNAWMAEHDQCSSPKMLSLQVISSNINNSVEKGKHIHGLQEKLALLEDSVSNMAANLKKTSGQLDAKIDDNVLLLSCIQSKLSSIEGLVTRMEALNCEDLRD